MDSTGFSNFQIISQIAENLRNIVRENVQRNDLNKTD